MKRPVPVTTVFFTTFVFMLKITIQNAVFLLQTFIFKVTLNIEIQKNKNIQNCHHKSGNDYFVKAFHVNQLKWLTVKIDITLEIASGII